MTWTLGYGPSALPTTDGLGANNYNYAVRIPATAISRNGPSLRLQLRGPGFGQSRVQVMWIGHAAQSGDGFDFDASLPAAAVRVGGSSSFVVPAGSLVVTDELAFSRTIVRDLVIAYGLLAGDQYASNSAMGAGFVHYYKAGSAEAAIVDKSGYTTLNNRTALIESIEVNDGSTTTMATDDLCAAVRAGQFHSSGGDVPGLPGSHLHFLIVNPAVSTFDLMLYQIMVTAAADTAASLRSYQVPLPNVLPKCNLMFGAGQSTANMTWGYAPNLLGVFHSVVKLRSGVPERLEMPFPIVGLPPGQGVLLGVESPGVGAACNFEWRQIPLAAVGG